MNRLYAGRLLAARYKAPPPRAAEPLRGTRADVYTAPRDTAPRSRIAEAAEAPPLVGTIRP